MSSSLFLDYFSTSCLIVFNNYLYHFDENKSKNWICLNGSKHYLQKTEPVSFLMKLSNQRRKNPKKALIKFLLQEFFNKNILETPVSSNINIFDTNYLIYFGKLFPLIQSHNFQVKINGQSYTLGSQSKKSLLDYDNKFQNYPDPDPLISKILQGEDYCQGNYGIHYNDTVYITKKILPFIIEDAGKKYLFPGTRVGLPLFFNKEISWTKPIVIDPYSHPALHFKNGSYQPICCGPFNFEILRQKSDLVTQIKSALFHAERLLTEGVWDNAPNAWHRLSSFSSMEEAL